MFRTNVLTCTWMASLGLVLVTQCHHRIVAQDLQDALASPKPRLSFNSVGRERKVKRTSLGMVYPEPESEFYKCLASPTSIWIDTIICIFRVAELRHRKTTLAKGPQRITHKELVWPSYLLWSDSCAREIFYHATSHENTISHNHSMVSFKNRIYFSASNLKFILFGILKTLEKLADRCPRPICCIYWLGLESQPNTGSYHRPWLAKTIKYTAAHQITISFSWFQSLR